MSTMRKVPQGVLGVSEPNPYMFGNDANPRSNPAWSNKNWLKSRFHFSFAEYMNRHNTNFGVLRVMNDDLVQPKRGFGMHGHRDAEICTYVVDGELTHMDSMGTRETLGPGSIQFMTAGSGVQHSEHNLGSKPLRFIQMWLTPRARGLPPNYGSTTGSASSRQNQWHHMVSDVQDKNTKTDVEINADSNMYASEISEDKSLKLEIAEGRQAYLLCIDGTPQLAAVADGDGDGSPDRINLDRHDASEIVGPLNVEISGPGHVLVVEMAFDPRNHGRGDI